MGLFDSIGTVVNDILGGTTSARKADKYALRQQAIQNAYNKETMQNLHQWEVEDLKKAGLNPALSYGGNTSGIATGTASGPQAATGDPIAMISNAFDIGQKIKNMELTSATKTKTEAETELTQAETANKVAENKFISDSKKAEISNLNASAKYTNERARGYTTSETRSTGSGYWGLSHNSARTISKTE